MVVKYMYKSGKSLFESDADVLVNTVNVKGVMGAGIAKEFKSRFPEMFREYRRACRKGDVHVYGRFEIDLRSRKDKKLVVHEIYSWKPHVWVGKLKDRKIIVLNFPTKIYWDLPSDYKIVEEGLKWLKGNIDFLSKTLGRKVKKIAMPQLGCGLGGLKWSKVKRLIEKYFKNEKVIVEVYVRRKKRRKGKSILDYIS